MPSRVQQLALTALTCVLGVLLCLAETASGVAVTSPGKTASGEFFETTPFGTGEIVEESLQPRRGEAASLTELASGRRCWLSPDPLGETGPDGANLYTYVQNNPINGVDPLGLATAIAIGCATDGNPFGHTAVAITGKGVFTFGTGKAHPLGSNFTDYLDAQAKYRDTVIYVLPTTPAQEKAIADYLHKLKGKSLPNAKSEPRKAMKDNCNTRTMDAFGSAGFPFDRSAFPAEFQRQIESLMKATKRGFDLTHRKGASPASNYGAFNPTP